MTGATPDPAGAEGLPYMGLSTFLGWPTDGNGTRQPHGRRLVALGIPYDEGTPYRAGARLGPRAIREASMRLRFASGDGLSFFDAQLRRSVCLADSAWDAGDVDVFPARQEHTFAAIVEAVAAVCAADAVPVVLGGDNTITLPVLRGVATPAVVVVQLDAHLDYGDGYFGAPHGNSTPMRSLRREGLARQVLHLGIRGYDNAQADLRATESDGNIVVVAEECRSGGALAAIEALDPGTPVYVSLDIDVADPGIAPGTGYLEPGGLDYPRLRELMLEIGSRCELLGCELVEVSPPYDVGGATALLGVQLLVDLLGAGGVQAQTHQKETQ